MTIVIDLIRGVNELRLADLDSYTDIMSDFLGK